MARNKKTKGKKKNRDEYSSKHHLTPKSRGGSNDEKNIKENCLWGIHKTWNKLFNDIDLRPAEIILIVQHLGGKESFIKARSDEKRPEFKQAWEKLFGNKSDEEIIELIKKEWIG